MEPKSIECAAKDRKEQDYIRITRMEENIASLDGRIATVEVRVATHGREIDELRLRAERDSVVLAQINATTTSIQAKVEEMYQRPAKNWQSLAAAVISAIVTGVIAYLLTQVGLK